MRKIALSGVKPSGVSHLGNYFGAMKQFVVLQEQGHELFFFIADFHALTTMQDAATMRQAAHEMALAFQVSQQLAKGPQLDPQAFGPLARARRLEPRASGPVEDPVRQRLLLPVEYGAVAGTARAVALEQQPIACGQALEREVRDGRGDVLGQAAAQRSRGHSLE